MTLATTLIASSATLPPRPTTTSSSAVRLSGGLAAWVIDALLRTRAPAPMGGGCRACYVGVWSMADSEFTKYDTDGAYHWRLTYHPSLRRYDPRNHARYDVPLAWLKQVGALDTRALGLELG